MSVPSELSFILFQRNFFLTTVGKNVTTTLNLLKMSKKIPDTIDNIPAYLAQEFFHDFEYQQIAYATAAVSIATFLLTNYNTNDAVIVGGAHLIAHYVGLRLEDTTKTQFTFASQINLAGTATFATAYFLTGDWKIAVGVTAAHAATHYLVDKKQGGKIAFVEGVERTFGFNL